MNNLSQQHPQKVNNQIIGWNTLICGGIGLYYEYHRQKTIKKQFPNYQINYGIVLRQGAIGGLVGFGTGHLICHIRNYFIDKYDRITPINENEYLKETLNTYEADDNFEANIKAQNVMNQLYHHFYDKLEEVPDYQGSKKKGTANLGFSDNDIALRFKTNSFHSLEAMNDAVRCFFVRSCDKKLIEIRQQKHSIGLIYKSDGQVFKLKIVSRRKQPINDAYSIYVAPTNRFEKSTYRNTNTKTHEDFGRYAKSKKAITRLLKINKEIDSLPLKGFVLERLVINAVDKLIHNLPRNRFDRLKLVVKEITNQICDINLIDPANSNNILTSNLTLEERSRVYNHYSKLSSDLDIDTRILRRHFPKMQNKTDVI